MGAARKLVVPDTQYVLPPARPALLPPLPPDGTVEAHTHPAWRARADGLHAILRSPLRWPQLLELAAEIGWSRATIANVLAVLEGERRAEALKVGDVVVWRRR